MLAVLAEGDQVVLIDNVERPLEGDTLCVVLTSEYYRQRVLGRTEMMSVPTTTLFLATGNHLVISGDLRTRALMCRIDPKTEHPEQRQFDVELREWMTRERPKLVAAGLTMMRAFIATGQRPREQCETWGRFEKLVGHGARAAHLARLRGPVRFARRARQGGSPSASSSCASSPCGSSASAPRPHRGRGDRQRDADSSFGLSTEAKALHELLVEICKRPRRQAQHAGGSRAGSASASIASSKGKRIARGPGKDTRSPGKWRREMS
jgi:hypothetical protein